ncbi:ATP-dependent Clp protease proteolytic subunit [Cardinium endosymbiont of Tipula unca]|uniref:ATP-dependent Clp protease proteolytic subunit n=1 Tax=Cardinium endosymbiont of Tipula unca TaxID=3066216 RepID=UPI0030CB8C2B
MLMATSHNRTIAKNATNNKDASTEVSKSASEDSATDMISKVRNELEAENSLSRARLEKQLSSITSEIERLRLERERKRLRKEVEEESEREAHDKAMRLLGMEKERLVAEMELAQAKFATKMKEYNIQIAELEVKAQLERGNTQLLQEKSNRLKAEVSALQAEAERVKHIQKKPVYLKDPLRKEDNILVVSDRCIELSCSILPWTANRVVDQIQYFNNKDSGSPIFIVIGRSPGGSVNAGWGILQAMQASKAPVYVVVKEFAASMAAVITTLAAKSYAYPDAIILHHHPSSCYWFCDLNLREMKEEYERLNKVWERLGGRVAKKMGIPLKELDKKLYEKSMYGAWHEYGDSAKKLKWVDYVINGMENTAITVLPDLGDYTSKKYYNHYYGVDASNGTQPSDESRNYYALALHDFDYSYKPDQKAQVVHK